MIPPPRPINKFRVVLSLLKDDKLGVGMRAFYNDSTLSKYVYMLKLYNSLTKKIEDFKPLKDKLVTIYNCGPTVYNYAHIGNFRTYIIEDVLRRYLEYSGYKVRQIMNITDVGHMTSDADEGEDKMEKAAKLEKKTPYEIAVFYERAFFEDIDKINIKRAEKYPAATEHIEEMIELVKKLIENDYAYEDKGNVYYDITRFKDYGKLSGNTLEQLKAGARLEINPEKKNPFDFALWITDSKHIMGWESPWSKHGYPGWHLECSAMAMKYLGETIDIHAGGEDNKFPHHEAEIAQSEAVNNKPFVKYWLHVKHLLVNNEKMSKSKGNFFTLRDIENKGFDPLALRLMYLQSHYQSSLNFTLESLQANQTSLNNIRRFIQKILQIPKKFPEDKKLDEYLDKATEKFNQEMDNNLNTPNALSIFQDIISRTETEISRNKISVRNVYQEIIKLDEVLGLNLKKVKIQFPMDILKAKDEREAKREMKKYEEADQIRKQIKKAGFDIEDLLVGPVILNRKF